MLAAAANVLSNARFRIVVCRVTGEDGSLVDAGPAGDGDGGAGSGGVTGWGGGDGERVDDGLGGVTSCGVTGD